MAGRTDGVDDECATGQTCTARPRFRSATLNLRPFRCAHPGQLPDGTMDFSQTQLSPTVHQRSGHVSPQRTVRTIREYDQEIENVQKENFNLKLRLYFLEQNLDKKFDKDTRDYVKVNVQLKIETEILRKDLAQKTQLLQDALDLIEKQEENHKTELIQAKEVQGELEEKVKTLQQEIEKLIHTPRSSDGDSEFYKQAFCLDENSGGRPSTSSEKSIAEMKLQLNIEIEKLQSEVETKDKEIKKMKDDIIILENKNKLQDKRVEKRNIAIQGLYQVLQTKQFDPPKETLYENLSSAIEAANSGNQEGVISMMNEISASLSELFPSPDSKVSICLSSDLTDLKSEVLRRDEVIEALERELLEQAQRSSGKLENPFPDNIAVEKECGRLQKAVREKDLLIQELLNERTNILSEHQQTVESLLSKLGNVDQKEQLANEKRKSSALQESESLKMMHELISEKDAEIDLRKQAIDLLNTQLAECRRELQNSVEEAHDKDNKLLEMSNRARDLERQLTALQQQLQSLKSSLSMPHLNPSNESPTLSDERHKKFKSGTEKTVDYQLINFDESLRPDRYSVSEEYSDLTDSHHLHSKENKLNLSGDRLIDENIVASDNVNEMSKTIFLDASGKDRVKLSVQVKMKEKEKVKSEAMLLMMEHDIETSQQTELLEQLMDRRNEANKFGDQSVSPGKVDTYLVEGKEQLQQEVLKKTLEIDVLTSELNDMKNKVVTLKSKLHSSALRVEELEKASEDNKDKPKDPTEKLSASPKLKEKPSSDVLHSLTNTSSSFESQNQSLMNFGQSNSVADLKEEIWLLMLTVEQKDKEIQVHKQKINELEERIQNLTSQNQNYGSEVSGLHKRLNQSQEIGTVLLQRLEELSRFMQSVLKYDETGKLDASSLSPESMTRFLKFLDNSRELSQNLSQNLSMYEESKIYFDEFPEKPFEDSSYISPKDSKQRNGNFVDNALEGKKFELPHTQEQHVNRAGKRRRWSYSLQHVPAAEHDVEPTGSEQLVILGTSDNEDILLLLNEQGIPENVLLKSRVPEFQGSVNPESMILANVAGCQSNVVAIDSNDTMNNSNFSDYVYDHNMCWNEEPQCVSNPYPEWPPQNQADLVIPFVPNNVEGTFRGEHCVSSDSDIWSEPDRNVSLQRIGIEIKTPMLHYKSPSRKHRYSKDKSASWGCSSEKSPSGHCSPKGKSFRRRCNSGSSTKHVPTDQAVEAIIENYMRSIGQSMEEKLSYLLKLFQNVQVGISDLSEIKDQSTTNPEILKSISEGIKNLQSTLSDAVNDVKILKEKSKISHTIQDSTQAEDRQSHFDDVNEITDVDQLKQMLAKELQAKEAVGRKLSQYEEKFVALKKQLKEIKAKSLSSSVSRQLVFDKRESHAKAGLKTEDFSVLSHDIELLNNALAQEMELNAELSEKVDDLQNENDKLKTESKQFQNVLSNKQEDLNEITTHSLLEQENIKELKNRKTFRDNKSSNLITDVENFKSSLCSEVDQNEVLKKKVNHLTVENRKLKGENEQLKTELKSEREQLESVTIEMAGERESTKKIAREKLAAETKVKNLLNNIEQLESSLCKDGDKASSLNHQVSQLLSDNRKLSMDLEQLDIRFKSQVDHFEKVSKDKNDLHKQNLTLSTEKSELSKKLEYQEERMKQMTEEKNELTKKLLEGNRQIIRLNEESQRLEDHDELLGKEINQYKAKCSSADALCEELKHDLKQTKEKLQKIDLKCKQCENDLTKITATSETLLNEKKVLEEEVESQNTKLAELSKQNLDMKKLVKDLKSSSKEMEREKSSLTDEIENLKTKESQIISSHERIVFENKDLAAKVNNLEVQLKSSDVALQNSKDEQEHLKLQLGNLQNKIKRKESTVKELEEQKDALQDQLKDLQHNLKKSKIDVKHLEDENYSLQQQINNFQRQLDKSSSHLDLKEGKMKQLKEQIFDLEHQIKDYETAQKVMEQEKKQAQFHISSLLNKIQNKESHQKQLEQEVEMLEDKVTDLQQQQLSTKDMLKKKFEEEKLSLMFIIDEKEESLKKLVTNSKKMEEKLSTFHDTIFYLQQQVAQSEAAKKHVEEEVESLRREISRFKLDLQNKSPDRGSVSSDRLIAMENQLKHKEQYCKTLEAKVDVYYSKITDLLKESEKGSFPGEQLSAESEFKSNQRLDLAPVSKQISIQAESVDSSKTIIEKLKNDIRASENVVHSLHLNNNDLKQEIIMLTEKLELSEKLKSLLEEERKSFFGQIKGSRQTSNVLQVEEMIREIQFYTDQIKKLEDQVKQKNTFINDIKQELFTAHNILLEKQECINHLEVEIKNCQSLLKKLQFDKKQLEMQFSPIDQNPSAQVGENQITFDSPQKYDHENDIMKLQRERDYFKNLVYDLQNELQLNIAQSPHKRISSSSSKSDFSDLLKENVELERQVLKDKLSLYDDGAKDGSKSIKKFEDRIKELGAQLEDARIENFQLQESVCSFLQNFGFQNNILLCKKCGKSASLSLTQFSSSKRSNAMFSSLYEYAEKTAAFRPEENIQKLNECKWNLQKEILDLQKNVFPSNSPHFDKQNSFNKRIAKMTSQEDVETPVKIWSEPAFFYSPSSNQFSKYFKKSDLLWKKFLLYIQLDIECLQNYRSFLKHHVMGIISGLTESRRNGSHEYARSGSSDKKFLPYHDMSNSTFGTFNSEEPPSIRSSLSNEKFEAMLKDSVFLEPSNFITTGTLEEGPLSTDSNQVMSSTPFLIEDVTSHEKSFVMKELKQKTEEITRLKAKVKELKTQVEGLQLDNKELHKQLKQAHAENRKSLRSKSSLLDSNREKQLEKLNEDLTQRLRHADSVNKSFKLELETLKQLFKKSDLSKGSSSETETVSKSFVLELFEEIKSLKLELENVCRENNILRKKLGQASLQTSASKPYTRILPNDADTSSDKESMLSTDATMTLSRSVSISQGSLDSIPKLQAKPKAINENVFIGSQWNEFNIHKAANKALLETSQDVEGAEAFIDSTFQRSHFSSPDLGIESDPNHEIQAAEYDGRYDMFNSQRNEQKQQPASPLKKRAEQTHQTIAPGISSDMVVNAENCLHAIAALQDFELLKKEVDESLVGIRNIHSRAEDCLKHFSTPGTPSKNLGCSTLKEILSCCSNIDVCQQKAKCLVNNFWVSNFPITDQKSYFGALLQQNQELCLKLAKLQERMKKQAVELKEASVRLKMARKQKEAMEKALFKQLSKTNKCLEMAKTNLSEKEQKTQLLLQFSNGKVSFSLPNTESSPT